MEYHNLLSWIKEKYNITEVDKASYSDLLEAVSAYVYRFNTGKEQCVQNGYLSEEEILEVDHLIALEVLFGEHSLGSKPKKTIGYKKFAEDYMEYLEAIDLISECENEEGEILLAWIGDVGATINEPNSENPKRSKKFFLESRAKDFYQHMITGKEVSEESELLFFHLFSVYRWSEDDLWKTPMEPIKISMSKYRKMGDDNLEFNDVLVWYVKAARGIGKVGRFGISYSGIVEFLANFNFKKDFLRILWIELINAEFSTMEGGLPIHIYSDFREIFNRWLAKQGVNIMGETRKDGFASISSSNVLALIRKNLGKKNKMVTNKEHFTFNVPEEYLESNEAMLLYDRAQSYNYFWVGMYSLISEAEDNMISMAELHCVILYVMRRLEELETPDALDWNFFMNEIQEAVNNANCTIAHTQDMVKEIIRAYSMVKNDEKVEEVLLNTLLETIENW